MSPTTVEDVASEVDAVVESPEWREAGLDPEALARSALAAASAEIGAPPRPVAVVFADDALIRRLNGEFLGKDAPTNVLAFPAAAGPATPPSDDGAGPAAATQPLGDIVLAYETIAREAAAHGIPLADRALHLIVHGFLHLHGYDHETDDDAEKMEAMERMSLARLGLADPYEVDADA
jgi:probable rRNA maturation factor